ncbi:MAG: phage portal protein [Defluviitaleaceae bacterium]|nr:phage portal protein [Defluviitaleaceae bacterium]
MIFTYQDFLKAKEEGALEEFIRHCVDGYIGSYTYRQILMNEAYFRGENPTLMAYFAAVNTEKGSMDMFPKIRVPSGVFARIVTLQVNRLWYNGVTLDDGDKKRALGEDFDKVAKDIATNAAVHGVCYGFWNYDTLQMFSAKEYFPLVDERSGEHRGGVRFFSIGEGKPWVIQLYEEDGWSEFSWETGEPLVLAREKESYRLSIRSDALGEEIVGHYNYTSYPVLPVYANSRKSSELTASIKAKVDLFDAIMTTFGDTMLKTKAIYWIFEGMSGAIESLVEAKETIERLGIIAWADDTKARPESVSLPYEATMGFLAELEKGIFRDAMVTNPQEIMGGHLTATAIKASYHAEKLKVSDMEWQAWDFIRRLLLIVGIENEIIRFKHETVSNDMEVTQRLNMYTNLPIETKVKLDPLFPEEIEEMVVEEVKEGEESGYI